MFKDYSSCVQNHYQKKKDDGSLPSNLIQPTPAKIKNECISICDTRDLKRDEKFLKEFFGPRADVNEYQQAIKRFDTDKFRPLCNLLRGKVGSTDDKNIELLAWLTDFPLRPHRAGWTPPDDNNTKDSLNTTYDPGKTEDDTDKSWPTPILSVATGDPAKPVGGLEAEKRASFANLFRKRLTIILSLGLALSCAIGYYVYYISKPTECMYWTGDHYAPISCARKIFNKTVIPMDTMMAAHFRKITRPDTITLKAQGSVWYSKIDGKVEFFTADGLNPEHPEKELRRATSYIIKKYGKQKERRSVWRGDRVHP